MSIENIERVIEYRNNLNRVITRQKETLAELEEAIIDEIDDTSRRSIVTCNSVSCLVSKDSLVDLCAVIKAEISANSDALTDIDQKLASASEILKDLEADND